RRRVNQMVCRGHVKFVRYLYPTTILELAGVYLELQTEFPGLPKNPARLERVKRFLLTEYITEFRFSRSGNLRQYFVDDTQNILRVSLAGRIRVITHVLRD